MGFSKSFENGPNSRHMCMELDAISESQNYHPTLLIEVMFLHDRAHQALFT